MNAETFNLEQALSDILDASPGPAREFVYGYHWKRLAASEGHMKRLPSSAPEPLTQRVETIRQLIAEGFSVGQIAMRVGITKRRVDNIISQHGLTTGQRKLLDITTPEELQRLVDAGMKTKQIARRFDFDASTVRRSLARVGIKRRA